LRAHADEGVASPLNTKVEGGFAVGDLAFFIFSGLGVVSFEGTLPAEVAQ
jgi:hypothetical protein